ncbi:hypothetical protein ACTFIR_010762 [Dictyostelium discoideum]
MLTISRGLLTTSKTKNFKSVFSKSFGNFFKDGELVEKTKENENENENNQETIKEKQQQPQQQQNDGILFNGSIAYRDMENQEFSQSNYPTMTTTPTEKEEERIKKNAILSKDKEAKDKMVQLHIQKDPTKKELVQNFYRDYRNKEMEKKIGVELTERDREFVYDNITLDPPANPQKQLEFLLESIKSNESLMFTDQEYQVYHHLLNHKNSLTKEQLEQIEVDSKEDFQVANKLYVAGSLAKSFQVFKKLSDTLNHSMSDILIANMYFTGVHPKEDNNNNKNNNSGVGGFKSITESILAIDKGKPDYNLAFKHFYKAATVSKMPVAFGMMGEFIYKGLVKDYDFYFKGGNRGGGGGGAAAAAAPILDSKEKRLSMAKVCFAIASQLGLKSSTQQLAFLFLNEMKNDNGAIEILKRLALKHNDINAVTTIGALLLDGHPSTAKDLWLYASKMGDSNAQTNLGRYYYNDSKNPDYNNAFLLWSAASKRNNSDAQFYLGGMFHSGLVVEKDIQKSLRLYEISAKNGNSNSQFLIGRAYIEGDGVEKNLEVGYKFLSKSINQDNQTALNYLNDLDETEKEKYLNKKK